jgi:hypothetical protein
VATLVQLAGKPEAIALGVGLVDVEGRDDGLETAVLGVALETGVLADGLATGPAHATNRTAIAATAAKAGRTPIGA